MTWITRSNVRFIRRTIGCPVFIPPRENRLPHTSNGTLELQPDWFLNPSKIAISSEAFWNIGKHCRIEVRCDLALQPEDAGAEVVDWVPKL
jgi:hypothetical protein